jgi:two-component system invasion response regulator UvrY
VIRVLIIDDHDIVREGLKQIVHETGDIVVGGEARTGAEALERVREERVRAERWDVAILDLNLPDRPGLDVLTQIRAIAPHLPVLILSMHQQVSYAARALKAGAYGYVSKDSAREHLVQGGEGTELRAPLAGHARTCVNQSPLPATAGRGLG